MLRYFSVIICFFTCTLLQGQVIFPNLTGNELLSAVQASYTPNTVLDYDDARDVIYGELDIVNDTVYGIYSQHGIYVPPTAHDDIRAWLYTEGNTTNGGGANAINAEHVYPQSKGATRGTAAHSDMHHVFPSRLAVNSLRDSDPFGEIPDASTEHWLWKRIDQNQIPSSSIDNYSEQAGNSFEPREAVKGDVARAVMYIYTIYRSQAQAADPNFFDAQIDQLCQWHKEDPADAAEIERSNAIAFYQDNKDNPFVLDCSLAERLYCPNLNLECMSAQEEVAEPQTPLLKKLRPNKYVLDFNAAGLDSKYQIFIHSSAGALMHHEINFDAQSGRSFEIPQFDLKGIYFLHLIDAKDQRNTYILRFN